MFVKKLLQIGVKNTVNHYNEATLVKKLESLGIGRPSTYCSIVEKLKIENMLKRKILKELMNFINFELLIIIYKKYQLILLLVMKKINM